MKTACMLLVASLAILAVSCFEDSCDNEATGPSPTSTTSIIEAEPPPAPERVDQPPSLHNAHIFTFFSATITYDAELGYDTLEAFESQYIVKVARYMLERGKNTARIGAQVDGWCDNGVFYLPCGPAPFTDEWRENLVGMLELTARIPGFQVQLIPTFTHKGDNCGQRCLIALTREVVRIVQKGKYQHIIWDAFNEFWHPSTREADDPSPWWGQGNLTSDVLLGVLSELPYPRGTDFPDNGGEGGLWRGELTDPIARAALRMCDYVAFHPSRNPEPTVEAYSQTMRLTGKPVLFDETVSWISEAEAGRINPNSALYTRGTEEEMRRQVNRQQRALCDAGATCSFHALWLFSYDQRIDWAPRCPCN